MCTAVIHRQRELDGMQVAIEGAERRKAEIARLYSRWQELEPE